MTEPPYALDEVHEPDISNLVIEDDEPVDGPFSEKQMRLLTESLRTSWKREAPYIACANVGLFSTVEDPPLVPDVMVSLDVQFGDWREKKHNTYLVWVVGKPPDIAIEVVSNRKGGEEAKAARYARIGVAYYVIYDPEGFLSNRPLRAYQRNGIAYVDLLDPSWLPDLGLGLTLWEGQYEDWPGVWLRWCDREGNLLPTGAEAAREAQRQAVAAEDRARALEREAERASQQSEQERQRAEQERQRAEQERQRADALAAKLRALGVEE